MNRDKESTMRQRTALIMAMVLTSFMLVIAAAVIARFTLAPTGGGVSGTAPLDSAPTVSPNAAEYQQALQTANAQLEQANRQLEEAYRRLTAEPGTAVSTTSVTTSAMSFAVSPEQAVGLAAAAVPGAIPVGTPEVVDFAGIPAYAVPFERGAVYVDPNSGKVVHSDLPSAPSLPSASEPITATPETPPAGAPISEHQAVATARAYAGGGTVERVRLEEEHGQLVYEVRFTNNSRVYIDPVSGRVIYARLEGDDKGGNDD